MDKLRWCESDAFWFDDNYDETEHQRMGYQTR